MPAKAREDAQRFRSDIMSADADTNSAPGLTGETCMRIKEI